MSAPPDPIPNSEVKSRKADDSGLSAKVGNSSTLYANCPFFVWGLKSMLRRVAEDVFFGVKDARADDKRFIRKSRSSPDRWL